MVFLGPSGYPFTKAVKKAQRMGTLSSLRNLVVATLRRLGLTRGDAAMN